MLRAIAFYALVAIGIPVGFFSPFNGLLFYLFFAHGHVADFVWPSYVFNYGTLIANALLGGYVFFELRHSPPRLRGMMLVLTFWAWLAMASVLAFDTAPAYMMLWRYSRILIMGMLVAALANSEDRIRKILYVVAGSLGVLGAKGLLDVVLTGGRYRMRGPGGMMSEENEYALGMNMAISILLGMAAVEDRKWLRRSFQVMALGCAATVIFTHSRSGLLGLCTVALLTMLYAKRKLLAPIGLACGVVLFLVFAPDAAIERYKTIPTARESDPSAIGRLQAWETAIGMAKDHPVFGVGPRNFELVFSRYSNYEPRAPHNAFVALAAESGIPSCLLFLAIVLGASWRMFRLRRLILGLPGFERLAAYCLIIHTTLIVYIVPNLFINRQDADLMYHLVGIAAGLAFVVEQKLCPAQERVEEVVSAQAVSLTSES